MDVILRWNMLKITDVAKDQIDKELSNNPGKVLRVVIEGFGWGGPRLGLVLDEPDAKDVATPMGDVEIVIPKNLEGLAAISILDYWPLDGFSIERAENAGCWIKNLSQQLLHEARESGLFCYWFR